MYDTDKGMNDYAEWDCCDDPDVAKENDDYICQACGEDFEGRTYREKGYLVVKPKHCSTLLPGGWKQECCYHASRYGTEKRCCQCRGFIEKPNTETNGCVVCKRQGDGEFVDYPVKGSNTETETAFTCYHCMEALLTFIGININISGDPA